MMDDDDDDGQWRLNEFVSGGGTHVRRKLLEKEFLSRPSTFLALRVQLVVLESAFVMVSTVWSVSCLLFIYSRRPPTCRAIYKSGGHVPLFLYPMESAPLMMGFFSIVLMTF